MYFFVDVGTNQIDRSEKIKTNKLENHAVDNCIPHIAQDEAKGIRAERSISGRVREWRTSKRKSLANTKFNQCKLLLKTCTIVLMMIYPFHPLLFGSI